MTTQQIIHMLLELSEKLKDESQLAFLLRNVTEGKDLLPPEQKMVSFPFASHGYLKIAIPLSGNCFIQTAGNCYSLHENQLLIIDKNTNYRMLIPVSQTEKTAILWVATTRETMRPSILLYDNGKIEHKWGSDIIAPGCFLLEKALKECRDDFSERDRVICAYLSAFLMFLARKVSFVNKTYDSDKKTTMVRQVQGYIVDNIEKRFTLQELSEIVSVSPSYLCRIFKQYTGTTIFKYAQDVRIQLAAEYLQAGELTISEIAEKLGYYDQFHFSKAFKAYMNTSPSDYGAENKKPDAGVNTPSD